MMSSEDVILQIQDVRYKSDNGTLYILSKRIVWILDDKHRMMVSHYYKNIKSQKISPIESSKVQLKLILYDGQSTIFRFINKDGKKSQICDRNKVKDILIKLLSKFKKTIDKELEEKNKLLSSNPKLFQLYRDLVTSGIITSKSFWLQYESNKKDDDLQRIGISGAFLTNIKPEIDRVYGLKYNITKETTDSIFKTYPVVYQKYLENVPVKVSDTEFWIKFFQSHYFHKDRIDNSTTDIFTECRIKEDDDIKKEIEACVDPYMDLIQFDNYDNNELKNNDNLVCQSIIKQLNRHSIMILKASDIDQNSSNPTREKNDDDFMNENISSFSYKLGNYLTCSFNNSEAVNSNSIVTKNSNVPVKRRANLLTNPEAVSVLSELSPGGILMKGFQYHITENVIPKEFKDEFRRLYVGFSELLKQFYACFPLSKEDTGEKLINVYNSLRKLHEVKLKPFENKILRELSSNTNHLTAHLNKLLDKAYSRFLNWEKRQIQK